MSEKLEECSVEGFHKAFEPHDKAIAVYTQPSCPHCKAAMDMLKVVAEKENIVLGEIDLTDEKCDKLADEHQVEVTPTILLLNRGVVLEKLTFDGLSPNEAAAQVVDKLSKFPQKVSAPSEEKGSDGDGTGSANV